MAVIYRVEWELWLLYHILQSGFLFIILECYIWSGKRGIFRHLHYRIHHNNTPRDIRPIQIIYVNRSAFHRHSQTLYIGQTLILPLVKKQQQKDLLPNHDTVGCGIFPCLLHWRWQHIGTNIQVPTDILDLY